MDMAASKLNPYELEAVLHWIDGYVLSRPSKRLSRDFSDGVLLAEILKCEFPKLVELHNYAACSGVQAKAKNWDALNRKVLRKLGIILRRDEIEKLARAETTFVEEVLLSVMKKVGEARALEQRHAKGDSKSHTDIMTIHVARQVGDHVEHIPQQMIPYASYEELQAKFDEQALLVKELNERINDLQSASTTKTQIIADLEERIEKQRRKKSSISSLRDSIANFF
jgi:hypothetical protein